MDQLPPHALELFPVVFSEQSGLTKEALELCLYSSMKNGVKSAADHLAERAHDKYLKDKELYYQLQSQRAADISKTTTAMQDLFNRIPLFNNRPKVRAFSTINDRKGYSNQCPSQHLLSTLLKQHWDNKMESMYRYQRSIGGTYLRSDATFKIAKLVLVDNRKVSLCMYTVMNEYSQVVTWGFANGESHEELEELLKKLKVRLSLLENDVRIWYSDICCKSASLINRLFENCKVKGDISHYSQRIFRSADTEHELYSIFVRELSNILLVKITGQPTRTPAPETLVSELRAFISQWKLKCPHFITDEVENEVTKLIGHIRNGCVCDEPFPEPLAVPTVDGKFKQIRGTSQLESLHRHLRSVLNGYAHGIEGSSFQTYVIDHSSLLTYKR